MKRKIVGLLVLLVAQLPALQSAQAFPDRPVKLVVASTAGGPPDIMARLLSDKLAAALGQPVIAEIRAVNPSVPAKSVAELVSLAKAQPGALRYGSAGIGTLPHLEGELLKARAGIDMTHVPYRGGGPALTGLLGGEVQIFFSALTQMLPYVSDGRLRGLAVTSETRSPLAPE